jgi:hypothetical protein
MKSNMRLLFTLGFVALICFTPSCKKDKIKGCMNIEATNYAENANVDDGSCVYARDKFLGNWIGSKLCSSNPQDSTSTILIVPVADNYRSIRITNFPFDGLTVNASVNSSNDNKLIIPAQEINNDLDVFTISGEGQVYESDFVINYLRVSDSLTDTCGLGLIKN